MLLLVAIALSTVSAYERLTEEEAERWLRSITLGEIITFVIAYDYVEHVEPAIEFPSYLVVVEGNDVQLIPQYEEGKDYQEWQVGHLRYMVRFPEMRFDSLIPPCEPSRNLLWGGIGLGAGLIAGAVVVIAVVLK